jgi:hypothetical protein
MISNRCPVCDAPSTRCTPRPSAPSIALWTTRDNFN